YITLFGDVRRRIAEDLNATVNPVRCPPRGPLGPSPIHHFSGAGELTTFAFFPTGREFCIPYGRTLIGYIALFPDIRSRVAAKPRNTAINKVSRCLPGKPTPCAIQHFFSAFEYTAFALLGA